MAEDYVKPVLLEKENDGNITSQRMENDFRQYNATFKESSNF